MVQLIDLKKLTRDLGRISETISKVEDIATTRALNAILKKEEKDIAVDVSKEYGITQAAARQKSTVTRATKQNKSIAITFRSTRMNLYKPKQLKSGGISFQTRGGSRVKVTTKINGGSKPFLINAKAGGQTGGDNIKVAGGNKKIPVYRQAGMSKVTTLRASSMPHMVDKLEISDRRLLNRLIKDFPEVYKKELKSASYTGRF